MEFIIYLIIGIIYAIASANGYNGRYSRNNFRLRNMEYGRYGLVGVEDDFSLSLDNRLNRIREEYDKRLMRYYAEHSPRLYLKNNHCELRLIRNEKGTSFYCKEKTNGNKKGKFFAVQGNNEHTSTMWAIIDMEFTKRTDYQAIKALYYRLNQTPNTTGGLRYFYEPFFKKYPDYDEKHAQNEYCTMEYSDNENCIICSELWSHNPKQFIIKGNKYLLLNLISEFKREKDKFRSFAQLFAIYSKRGDITVNLIPEQKTENPKVVVKQEPEAIENNVQTEVDDKKTSDEETEKFNDIKKYNERNLDL